MKQLYDIKVKCIGPTPFILYSTDDDSKDKDQTTEDVGTESNPVLSQATPVPSLQICMHQYVTNWQKFLITMYLYFFIAKCTIAGSLKVTVNLTRLAAIPSSRARTQMLMKQVHHRK